MAVVSCCLVLECFTALVSCDDLCNSVFLRDEVANLIPNPQCGGLGIVLSLPLPFELSGMVRPARRALWVTGITQAPPPRQGDNPWEETQFSHCQFPTVPKCPAVPVAAINCYVHQGYYSLN